MTKRVYDVFVLSAKLREINEGEKLKEKGAPLCKALARNAYEAESVGMMVDPRYKRRELVATSSQFIDFKYKRMFESGKLEKIDGTWIVTQTLTRK